MNLDAYRMVRLSHAEIASARAAFDRLRFEHGTNAPAVVAEMAREDENAYHTQRLSLHGYQRANLAKRLSAFRLMQHWFADAFSPHDDLFPGVVTLATQPPQQAGADAELRRHVFAAMIDAVLEAKKEHGEGHAVSTKVLAELSDLANGQGLDELRKMLAGAQQMGLPAEGTYLLGLNADRSVWLSAFTATVSVGVQNLGWEVSGVSRRSGKTRWRNNITGEYRYQETEPGTRVRRQRSAEIAKHHLGNIHQQREVMAEHLEEMGRHLPSMTVNELKQARSIMGAWKVKGGSIKENLVKAIHEYAKGLVEQHHKNEERNKAELEAPAVQPKGTQPIPPPAPHPEQGVTSNIDVNASPEEKVRQLQKLTAENKPLVDAFLAKLDAKFGTESKSNVKLPERILEKSRRPSILAKKPWFGVEHVRDSFRCKTVLKDITKLPEIIEHLKANLGAESVKEDVDKFLDPLGWGWRIVSFDMKMPNGQLIEYYLPVEELERQKGPNHVIFERWRNKDLTKLTPDEIRAYEKDREESQRTYQQAYDAYLARSGNTPSAIRAALTKAAASGPETDRNSSAVSSAENRIPATQEPLTSDAANPSSSTSTRPSGALDTTTGKSPDGGKSIVPTHTPADKAAGVAKIKAQGRAEMLKKLGVAKIKAQGREEMLKRLKGTPAAAPAVEQLNAANTVYQKHLKDVEREAASGIEKSKALMDKWSMSSPRDAIEREAKSRMNAEMKAGAPAAAPPTTFKNITDAANELQAIRNEMAREGHDPAELRKRVDAVGKWAAENAKQVGKGQQVLTEANAIADKLEGGSGNVGRGKTRIQIEAPAETHPSVGRALKRLVHVQTPEQVESQATDLWFNDQDAQKAFKDRKQFAKAVREEWQKANPAAPAASKHPIRQLYDRAGDASIPFAEVQSELAKLDGMGRANLLQLTDELELKGTASKSAPQLRQMIKQRILDRRSAAQRDQMIEDRGQQADKANAAAKIDRQAAVKDLVKVIGEDKGGADPRGDLKHLPTGKELSAVQSAVISSVGKHAAENTIGPDLGKLYDSVAGHLSPEQFRAVMLDLYSRDKIKLSGWPRTPDEIPRPELAPIVGNKVMYYAHPTANAQALSLMEMESIWLSIQHAPAGGVTIAGTFYPGGEFIPDTALEQASDDELAELLWHHEQQAQQPVQVATPVTDSVAVEAPKPAETPEKPRQPVGATVAAPAVDMADIVWPGEENAQEPAPASEQVSEVPHDVERTSESSSGGRVRSGEPAGTDAEEAHGEPVPGTGERDGQGVSVLPASEDEQRPGLRDDAVEQRDAPGVGAGADDGETPTETAGRGGQEHGRGPERSDDGRGEPSGTISPEAESSLSEPATPQNPTDVSGGNFHYTGRDFIPVGLKGKFRANVEAIRLLRNLEAEGRQATPEEQAVLAKYVGWGQFKQVFNTYGGGKQWEEERNALQSLLTPEEFESARESTKNAHYTHPSIVDAHWKMAQRLGFKGGRFLETSAGVGYYLGMMPGELKAKSACTAVEMDNLTGGILKHLYPKDNVQIQGFQDHQAPDGFYDLVASNVPFGDYGVHDKSPNGKRYNKFDANIHDYFFLKSVDLAKPGGLVMHITSTGTLDKQDSTIRKEIAKKCDLVGAIRFPGGAHKENAGTDVVTDLLVFRRRHDGEQAQNQDWLDITTVPDPDGGAPIPVNKYFATNPDMILGRLDRTGSMYQGESVNVSKFGTEEVRKKIRDRIEKENAELPNGFRVGDSVRGVDPRTHRWIYGKVEQSDNPDKVLVNDDGETFEIPKGSLTVSEKAAHKADRTPEEQAEYERAMESSHGLYEKALEAAINKLPANIVSTHKAPKAEFTPDSLPAPGHVKNFAYHIANGKLYVRDGGGMTEQKVSAPVMAKIAAHMQLRDAVRASLNAQMAGQDATAARAELNRVYDEFVAKHGPVSDPKNRKAYAGDPDSPVLLALEKYDHKTKTAKKADIFHRDTIRRAAPVMKAGTTHEALGVSLHDLGRLDLDHMQQLTGFPREKIEGELRESKVAYEDPSDGWTPADQYLSGNVRRKLALARAAAAADPKFKGNVEALEKVQPEDLDYTDIKVKMGANWVLASDYQAFAASLIGGAADPSHFHVHADPGPAGGWAMGYSGTGDKRWRGTKIANEVLGTSWAPFHVCFKAALNNVPIVFTPKKDKDHTPTPEMIREYQEATEAANAKVQEIRDKFEEWIWEDDERRARLHRYYNDNFNNIREITYNGQHLTFPGMDPGADLHKHIPNFVWQVITTGRGLAAHEVGMGKTNAMVASAMELRRMGLAKKPCIACLKANIEGVTADARKLYPGIKILSTVGNFGKDQRRKTIAEMATGDYDLVIMTHDNLNMLPMRPEVQKAYIKEEIETLREQKAEAAQLSGDKKAQERLVGDINKAIANLEAKLEKALDSAKDDAVFFEETGIDQLFVDESHYYKSLPVYSKQQRMKGIPKSRSDRATAMQMRARWLQQQNNGRGVVFATGTAVDNTMAELYTLQRYLQPEELKERGLDKFDNWAAAFGEVVTKQEPTVTGEYKQVSRFSSFQNIPELMQMARQDMDIQYVKDLPETKIVRPKRIEHVEAQEENEHMKAFMTSLVDRAETLKKQGGKAIKGGDNMLVICTDGRKGAVDLRLLDANAPDLPDSKTNLCVGNILRIAKERPGTTQMIFSNVGVHPTKKRGNESPEDLRKLEELLETGSGEDEDTPDGDAAAQKQLEAAADIGGCTGKAGFHLFGDIINKLVKGGIPREKIADFSDMTPAQKEAAQQGMRSGEILVALGSTKKAGTGVNVQDRLAAVHHLDVPWGPADLDQRDGRIIRQGNMNDPAKQAHEQEGHVYRYVAKGSLDEYLWNLVHTKAHFTSQVMVPAHRADKSLREVKDIDTEQISADELSAIASGNPLRLEKTQIDEDVRRLKAASDRHLKDKNRAQRSIDQSHTDIKRYSAQIDGYKEALRVIDDNPDFWAEINGRRYTDRDEAVKAFVAYNNKLEEETPLRNRGHVDLTIATLRGLEYGRRGQNYYFVLPNGDKLGATDNASIPTFRNTLERYVRDDTRQIESKQSDIERLMKDKDKPFKHANELQEKVERQKQIEKELGEQEKKKKGGDAGTAEPEQAKPDEPLRKERAESERMPLWEGSPRKNQEAIVNHFNGALRKMLRRHGYGKLADRVIADPNRGDTLPDDAIEHAVELRNTLFDRYKKRASEMAGKDPEEIRDWLESIEDMKQLSLDLFAA